MKYKKYKYKFISLKPDNTQLWFLYTSDLQISTAEKHVGINGIILF